MKNAMKKLFLLIPAVVVMLAFAAPVFAEEDTTDELTMSYETSDETAAAETASTGLSDTASKAFAAAIAVGAAAAAGAIGMAFAISKSAESIARQPEASGEIRSGMMLGLVFIETAIIYALIVAILIIFVL